MIYSCFNPKANLQVKQGVVSCMEIEELQIHGHREADTMMVSYASRLSETKKVILIRADDADVFIFMLHHQVHMSDGTTIFMNMGLSTKNNRRALNITQLATTLDLEVMLTLHIQY